MRAWLRRSLLAGAAVLPLLVPVTGRAATPDVVSLTSSASVPSGVFLLGGSGFLTFGGTGDCVDEGKHAACTAGGSGTYSLSACLTGSWQLSFTVTTPSGDDSYTVHATTVDGIGALTGSVSDADGSSGTVAGDFEAVALGQTCAGGITQLTIEMDIG